ncbi:MAG: SRPBCC family protein [Deltaproteobacteria bacterium]|nr:SRPBCC family protein [Deltaproteobacteria bacterium]
MWHRCVSSDLGFVARSPFRIEHEILVFAPPERVFDVLTGEREMFEWLEPLREVRWTSAPPHRAGSTREIVLDLVSPDRTGSSLTALAVQERILAWERGKRFTFSIEAMTLPLVREMVEDMQLERVAPGKTRLRYDAHYTPSLLTRAVHPVARALFTKMFRDAVRRIAMISARGDTTGVRIEA